MLLLLGSLSAAGLIMGFHFNGYALLASTLLLTFVAIVFVTHLGIAQSGFLLILGLITIQCAYGIALLASSYLSSPRGIFSRPHIGRE